LDMRACCDGEVAPWREVRAGSVKLATEPPWSSSRHKRRAMADRGAREGAYKGPRVLRPAVRDGRERDATQRRGENPASSKLYVDTDEGFRRGHEAYGSSTAFPCSYPFIYVPCTDAPIWKSGPRTTAASYLLPGHASVARAHLSSPRWGCPPRECGAAGVNRSPDRS